MEIPASPLRCESSVVGPGMDDGEPVVASMIMKEHQYQYVPSLFSAFPFLLSHADDNGTVTPTAHSLMTIVGRTSPASRAQMHP